MHQSLMFGLVKRVNLTTKNFVQRILNLARTGKTRPEP